MTKAPKEWKRVFYFNTKRFFPTFHNKVKNKVVINQKINKHSIPVVAPNVAKVTTYLYSYFKTFKFYLFTIKEIDSVQTDPLTSFVSLGRKCDTCAAKIGVSKV